VFSGGSLRLLDLTISGGDVTGLVGKDGGLILRQFSGILDIDRVILREGRARWGGALYEIGAGTTAMDNVAILDNRAEIGGGWYHNGNSTSALSNVTFSGNIATQRGGAMQVNAPVTLRHLTVTGNGALGFSGGGFSYSVPGNTGINIYNSVFAGNWVFDGRHRDEDDMSCIGGLGIRGHSLIGRGNCTFQTTNGPALSAEPRFAPLFDYGSGIPTYALLDSSPLIDAAGNGAGNAACRAVDARGVARPSNACDIGAHERVFNHVVNASGDFPDANPGNGVCATSNGQCTLRAAIQEAARRTGAQTIRVPPGTYTVTGMQDGYSAIWGIGSNEPRTINIVGSVEDPAAVVIQTTGLGGVFEVSGLRTANDVQFRATPALSLFGVTIRGAERPAGSSTLPELGGAIRVDGGNLLVYRSILRDNRAPVGDGGAIGLNRRFETIPAIR
jgi:CSLREA domain-containing protein